MVEDFNKKDEQKGSSEMSSMNFDENSTNEKSIWFDKDNPFEKIDNPFVEKTEPVQPGADYKVSNPNIESNKAQSRSLAMVLLALLLSIGLLVAALWGLSHKKNQTAANTPNNFYSQEVLPENNLKVPPIAEKTIQSAIVKTPPEPSQELDPKKYCKVSEAERYVSAAIADLDRVTEKLEEKSDDLQSDTGSKNNAKKLSFFKSKVEELSRAEAEIRAFSEPHLDHDLSITFTNEESPCKLKDRPKYLGAWLDEIKDRINGLYSDLTGLSDPTTTVAALPEEKPLDKPKLPEVIEKSIKQDSNAASTEAPKEVAKPPLKAPVAAPQKKAQESLKPKPASPDSTKRTAQQPPKSAPVKPRANQEKPKPKVQAQKPVAEKRQPPKPASKPQKQASPASLAAKAKDPSKPIAKASPAQKAKSFKTPQVASAAATRPSTSFAQAKPRAYSSEFEPRKRLPSNLPPIASAHPSRPNLERRYNVRPPQKYIERYEEQPYYDDYYYQGCDDDGYYYYYEEYEYRPGGRYR